MTIDGHACGFARIDLSLSVLSECTCRQSMNYLIPHATFVMAADLQLFCAGNLSQEPSVDEGP